MVSFFIKLIFSDKQFSSLSFHDVSGDSANDVGGNNKEEMVEDGVWWVVEVLIKQEKIGQEKEKIEPD